MVSTVQPGILTVRKTNSRYTPAHIHTTETTPTLLCNLTSTFQLRNQNKALSQRNSLIDSTMSESRPALEHVQEYWTKLCPSSPIYIFLLQEVAIKSASDGHVKATLAVESVHTNSKGTLHGTVSACIVDCFGGLAVASTGADYTGVSTDIHTTYVSTAKQGDFLEIEAKASKVGRTLAFTTVEIRKQGGGVVATGTHTKYVKV